MAVLQRSHKDTTHYMMLDMYCTGRIYYGWFHCISEASASNRSFMYMEATPYAIKIQRMTILWGIFGSLWHKRAGVTMKLWTKDVGAVPLSGADLVDANLIHQPNCF